MMLKFKITYLFLILFSFLSVICIIQNVAKAQENNNLQEDFSNAENAEEKRIKWGTDEFKLELIKEISFSINLKTLLGFIKFNMITDYYNIIFM